MDGDSISRPKRSNRVRKTSGRRPRGVRPIIRDGHWHAVGTVRIDGRSVRIRRSLGLAIDQCTRAQAEQEIEHFLADIKARTRGEVGRGDPVPIAALAYFQAPRDRPLGVSSVDIVKESVKHFGVRHLNEIHESEWREFIDRRQARNAPATRERFVSGVMAFLSFAKKYHGLARLPAVPPDNRARNPDRRARRRVEDLRPELIRALFDACHITIRAQLAVERCTGARVSSVLRARLGDLILAPDKAQITFRKTKSGEDVTAALDKTAVTAALDKTAVKVLTEYLGWRGQLADRDAPLFLTHRRRPYAVVDGPTGGNPNKTGFNAAKRRAAMAILAAAEPEEKRLRRAGKSAEANQIRDQATADAALIGRVTQHWFRHRLATLLLRHDPRAAMEQGGWLDIRSVLGYAHDAAEHRRAIVSAIDDLTPAGGL